MQQEGGSAFVCAAAMAVQKQDFSTRRHGPAQWTLVAIAGLAACVGLMVAGTNVYLSEEGYLGQHSHHVLPEAPLKAAQSNFAFSLKEGKAPVPTVGFPLRATCMVCRRGRV